MEKFKVIIVEDVPLELKGTEGILRNDIPEAEIIGTAASEQAYWRLIKDHQPDLVLLDLGLGGSTTVGVEICRQTKQQFPAMKVLIFTGEVLNEKLWVDALDAGADGISLKSGELLTRDVRDERHGGQAARLQPADTEAHRGPLQRERGQSNWRTKRPSWATRSTSMTSASCATSPSAIRRTR